MSRLAVLSRHLDARAVNRLRAIAATPAGSALVQPPMRDEPVFESLAEGFDWSATPEGYHHWAAVQMPLIAMADGEQVR